MSSFLYRLGWSLRHYYHRPHDKMAGFEYSRLQNKRTTISKGQGSDDPLPHTNDSNLSWITVASASVGVNRVDGIAVANTSIAQREEVIPIHFASSTSIAVVLIREGSVLGMTQLLRVANDSWWEVG